MREGPAAVLADRIDVPLGDEPDDVTGAWVDLDAARRQGRPVDVHQAQLAAALLAASGHNLDASAVTRLQRGERRIRLDEAVALCELLNLDLNESVKPHPGDAREQVRRAAYEAASAVYAHDYWKRERAATKKRLDEAVKAFKAVQESNEAVMSTAPEAKKRWAEVQASNEATRYLAGEES